MGVRAGLARIGLAGWLCLTLFYLMIAGHSSAGERQNQPRHSLVIRPATSPDTSVSIAPSRHSEKSKPLSLVKPIQPVRDEPKLISSMPAVAGSGTAQRSISAAQQ